MQGTYFKALTPELLFLYLNRDARDSKTRTWHCTIRIPSKPQRN